MRLNSYKYPKIKPLKTALIRCLKGDAFLEQKITLNYRLLDWLTSVIKDIIEDTVEDEPNKISTFIAVNNMLNELDNETASDDMANLISETLINKIFDEVKNSI